MPNRRSLAENTVARPDPAQHNGDGQEGTRANEQFVPPPVDIFEDENGLVVMADLPGVSKDGLNIEVNDNILTIQGRAKHNLPGEPVYREFELVNFFRQFQLSDQVDVTKITADLKHGVLTLRLPKAEQAKPKQIQVQVG
jgi:HSP20 family protein